MFASLFVRRPRLAFVISLIIVLAGAVSYYKLPVEEYPLISPPTILVIANYPGASAHEIAETVASPLEAEINGVEDMIYFTSQSDNSGGYMLYITFKSGADEDMALVNVNNAVKRAEHSLPTAVVNNGLIVVKRSSDMLAVLELYAEDASYTPLFLSNYASIYIKDKVARVPGVGHTIIFNESAYSMRVWLDPQKMRAFGISNEAVQGAIASQNVQAATGSVGTEWSSDCMQFKLSAKGRLETVKEFENIIVKSGAEGRLIRLNDIARIELGAETYSGITRHDGHATAAMAIFKLNDANALNIMTEVNKLMKGIEKNIPDGISWGYGYDSTLFVSVSMREIIQTLFITFALVVIITYLFLPSWRAALIPTLTIPVSLIGTFFFLYIFGMSVNTLSMFALILVIGSVVDNAICVTENAMRLIDEENLSPYDAAIKTMQQLSGALISTTFVVIAVYAPIAFYGGMVGKIYIQFSVTMCVALVISTVNALTLSPALCALLLRKSRPPRGFFKLFNSGLGAVRGGFVFASKILTRFALITLVLLGGVFWANYYLFDHIPGAFLPNEDKGALFCECILPPGATLQRTENVLRDIAKRIEDVPGIANITTIPGNSMTSGSGENVGLVIMKLEHWDLRKTPETQLAAIQQEVQKRCQSVTEASVVVLAPPPIMGLGAAGGVSFALQATGDQDYRELAQTANGLVANIMASGKAIYAFTSFDANTPMLEFELDRAKAEAMNVSVSAVFGALQSQLGSIYINDYNKYGKTYKVKIQSDKQFREDLNSVGQLYVTSNSGEQMPLDVLGDLHWTLGSRQAERFNMFPSATINAQSVPFFSSAQMMQLIENEAAKLGPNWEIAWTDMSYQESQNSGQIVYILALALLLAYLFLVAQYESWTLPVPVMLSVGTATLGGLFALYVTKASMDIYCQLGLLMLIGLTAKTAILMVEFSKQERERGLPVTECALNGMRIRFRAVMMTALSFVIGVVPLVVAQGAGAASRRSVGVTTFWGMLAATVVGMIFIPPLYKLFQTLGEKTVRALAPSHARHDEEA